MYFNLDFSLITAKERKQFVEQFDLSKLSQKEIELCSNYILYGKDENKDYTSSVDRKEIEIETKFKTYKKTEPISLDSLLDSPTFNENLLRPIKKSIYKKPKPVLDKEKVQFIPGMQELWAQIEKLQRTIDMNTGKIEPDKNFSPLSQKDLYYLKHILVEKRKEQYLLKDSYFPTIMAQPNKDYYYCEIQDSQLNYPVFPRGIMVSENDIGFKNPRSCRGPNPVANDLEEDIAAAIASGKPYFSFLDKNHIYHLILNYWELRAAIAQIPDSPLYGLLWTLDFYIEKAHLSEQQKLIVRDKKFKLPNKIIAQNLENELGITHQENYISTIWNKITGLIAGAAQLNYDEWLNKNFDKAWKICNYCHQELLRDPRNFVKKNKASDGFTGRCKVCDKILRQKKKEEREKNAGKETC